MNTLHHLSGLAKRRAAPRRTVRLRLTALYGALFLASGAGLLTITNILARGWSWPQAWFSAVAPAGSSHRHLSLLTPGPSQAELQAHLAAEHAAALNQLLTDSAIALGVMAVVSAALGWLMAGRVLRPLQLMTAAAQRISADSLHERLAMPGPRNELKDLADTIDALLERLDGAFAAQRRFTASASHELRTPLTTIRASLDVAIAKPRPVSAAELAGLIGAQLGKVDELLEGLLVLAQTQHGALPARAVLPVDDLVSATLAAREQAITARNLTVQYFSGGEGIWVDGSRPLLHRMVGNVINNAIGHNHHGGWMTITTQAGGGMARLNVENGGDILNPAQVAGLGQPFQRLGADRTGSDTGAGLGLSIVAAIAAAHRGTLALHARPGGGLKVTITLPLAPRAATVTGLPAGIPA